MAQIIRHRRGSLESLSAATSSFQKGELIIVSGSSNLTTTNGSSMVFAAVESGSVQAVNRFLVGNNAPNVFPAGTYNGLVKGVPYYASGSSTLYLLGSDGNDIPDLTGNISNFSASVATSFSASQASQTSLSASVASVTGNFSSSVATSFSASNASIVALSASVANVTGNFSSSVATSFSQSTYNLNELSASVSSSVSSLSASFDTRITNNSSSINTLSGSTYTISSSFDTRISNVSSSVYDLSSSFDTRITNNSSSISNLSGSTYTNSASFDTRITNLSSSVSSSFSETSASIYALSSSVANVTGNFSSSVATSFSASAYNVSASNAAQDVRINQLASFSGSYATTGSNVFYGTQIFTGSLYVAYDLIVQGSSSLQYITASQVELGTNRIILNNDSPAVRFGGISVQDSGSSQGASGSLLWDSLNNNWIYQHPSGGAESGQTAILISGPRNSGSMGSETHITPGKIMVAVGDDHIGDSIVSQASDNSKITIGGSLGVSGSIVVNDGITGTGSIFLQPDINDNRKLEIYNTGVSDVHLKSNGGLTFLGDDTNYVVVNASAQTVSVKGVNGVFIETELNVTGAISASAGFSGSIAGIGNVTAYSASVSASLAEITANVGSGVGVSITNLNSFTQSFSSSYISASASFDTRITNTSSSLSDLSGSVYNLSGSTYNLSSSLDTRITNVSSSLDTLSGSAYSVSSSFDTRITNVSSSLDTLSGSTYSISSSFNTRISNTSSSLNDLSGSTYTLSSSFDTRITNVSTSVDTLSGSTYSLSSSFDTRITNNSSSISTLSGSVYTLSSSLDTRITNVSSSLDLLSGSTYNLSSSVSASLSALSASIGGGNIGNSVTLLNSKTGSYATTGSNVFVSDQTINGILAISSSASTFKLEGNGFSQTYLTANGAIVLNPGYGGVEMVGSYRTFKATDITAEGTLSASVITGIGNVTAFSTSVDSRLSNLQSKSASVDISIAALNTSSASQQTSLDNLNSKSGSYATTGSNVFYGTQTLSGSFNVSGSSNFNGAVAVDNSNMNLGNSSSLNLTGGSSIYVAAAGVISGSIVGIGNVTAFSTSVDSRFDNLEATSASVNTSVAALNTSSASQQTSIDALNAYTSSNTSTTALNAFTASANERFTEIGVVSGSLISSASAAAIANANQNLFTASADGRLSQLETASGSAKVAIIELNNYTSSLKQAIVLSGQNVEIQGDLTVKGTTTSISSTTVQIGDNIIELNGTGAANGGLLVKDPTAPSTASGSLLWDSANDYWKGGTLGNESKLLRQFGDSVVSGSSQITISSTTGFETFSGSIATDFSGSNASITALSASVASVTGNFSSSVATSFSASNASITALSASVASVTGNFSSSVATSFSASAASQLSLSSSFASSQATQDTRLGLLETSTGSLNLFTSSIDTTIKTKLNAENVVSGSSQIDITSTTGYTTFSSSIATSISASVAGATWENLVGKPSGIVSGSSQIDITQTTGFTTFSASIETRISVIDGGTY